VNDMIVAGPDGDGTATRSSRSPAATQPKASWSASPATSTSPAPPSSVRSWSGDHRQPWGAVLDLGEVSFMDSAGVEALVRARERAGKRLHLRTVHPSVRRVLELVSLLEWIPIDADAPDDPHDRSAPPPTLTQRSRSSEARWAAAPQPTRCGRDSRTRVGTVRIGTFRVRRGAARCGEQLLRS
jgi:anti-anti-sigma factor